MNINKKQNSNKAKGGYLFIASGLAFSVTATLTEQISFYGVSAMFICLGFAFIIKSKKKH